MKWIGQHIWDFISRFRTTVYLENLETSSNENVLVVDSDGKVTKNTTLGGSDLTLTNEGDNRVITSTGGTGLNAEANITYNADGLYLKSALSSYPVLQLLNSNSDDTAPDFQFQKTALGADDDHLGQIRFIGDDAAGNVHNYVNLNAYIEKAASGAESGKFAVTVESTSVPTGSNARQAFTATGSSTSDRVSVDLGYGTTSTTTIAGDLTVTSGLTIGGHKFSDIDIGSEFVDTDDHIMSSGAIKEKIESYSYSTTTAASLGINGSANQLLTDDGDGTVTSESTLTYSSETLSLGEDDSGYAYIRRLPHTDGTGGTLAIHGGDATDGQTNQAGGDLNLVAGTPTGNASWGDIIFYAGMTGSSGTSLAAPRPIAEIGSTGIASNDFYLFEPYDGSTDSFRISVQPNGVTTLGTSDSDGSLANLTLDVDGNIELNADGGEITFKDGSATFGTIDSSSVFMKQTKVTLSESDCNSLHSTAINLVAAQGADQMTVPVSIVLLIDRDSSTAQAESACDLFISWDGSTTLGEEIGYARRFMYNESGDRTYVFNPVGGYNVESGQSLTAGENVPLTIKVDSAVTSGSIDGIVAYTTYYVIDNS